MRSEQSPGQVTQGFRRRRGCVSATAALTRCVSFGRASETACTVVADERTGGALGFNRAKQQDAHCCVGERWHARTMSWEPVTSGRSGAMVARGHGTFRKQVADHSVDLRPEAERLLWLQAQGIPAPEVLESQRSLLVTRAVPGLTAADPWPADLRPRVVTALARLSADLHSLSVEDCPFDRRLTTVLPQALEAEVDLSDLDPERLGWSRDELVAELLGKRRRTRISLSVMATYACPTSSWIQNR